MDPDAHPAVSTEATIDAADASPSDLSPTNTHQVKPAPRTYQSRSPPGPQRPLDAFLPELVQKPNWGTRQPFGINHPSRSPEYKDQVLAVAREMATTNPEMDHEPNMPPGLVLREGSIERPKPIGTPPSPAYLLLRYLPADWTNNDVRMIVLGFNEVTKSELLPAQDSPDEGYLAALLTLTSDHAAQDAKNRLQGKHAQPPDGKPMELLLVDKETYQDSSSGTDRNSPDSVPETSSRGRRTTLRDLYGPHRDWIGPFQNPHYSVDHAQARIAANGAKLPPIGTQRTDPNAQRGRTGTSSVALINGDAAADEETNSLMWNPRAFAPDVNGRSPGVNSQRRATAPTIPMEAMGNLSINTNMPPPGSTGVPLHYGHAYPGMMSPVNNGPLSYAGHNQGYPPRNHNQPAANLADQNPPCNTLYVGNLPMNTSEEELKATFSKQRGYKRLCYRTKGNGPMCFVEFEDISCATKTLKELYGHMLTNSTKGGIRLSFSKNPLGVRSNHHHAPAAQSNGYGNSVVHGAPGNGFTTAHGPPPGLSAPPGLGMPQASYHNSSQSQGPSPSGYCNGHSNGYSPGLLNGTASAQGNGAGNGPFGAPSHGYSNGAANGHGAGYSNGPSGGLLSRGANGISNDFASSFGGEHGNGLGNGQINGPSGRWPRSYQTDASSGQTLPNPFHGQHFTSQQQQQPQHQQGPASWLG